MGKQSYAHFNNMTVLVFSSPILLMGVGARNLMSTANLMKKQIKTLILPTPI
jgi:hypothetical protein